MRDSKRTGVTSRLLSLLLSSLRLQRSVPERAIAQFWRKDIRRHTNRMWRTGAMRQRYTRPGGKWPARVAGWDALPRVRRCTSGSRRSPLSLIPAFQCVLRFMDRDAGRAHPYHATRAATLLPVPRFPKLPGSRSGSHPKFLRDRLPFSSNLRNLRNLRF